MYAVGQKGEKIRVGGSPSRTCGEYAKTFDEKKSSLPPAIGKKRPGGGGGNARLRFISLVLPKVCFPAHVLGVRVCGSAEEKYETKISSAGRKRKHIDN